MDRIGILGGTFNPIHIGHIELAKAALEECKLDKVLIMPSGISYLKKDQNIPSGDIRLDICRSAIEEYSYFELSDYEVIRDGNTYTCDTLNGLKNIYPNSELFFIIGADSLFYIDKWVNPEIIFRCATIICSKRGYDYTDEQMVERVNFLKNKFLGRIVLLDSEITDISSTRIREMIRNGENKDSICNFIPEKEYETILKYNLYI